MKKDFAPWSEHALNEQLCGYTVAWEGNEMRTNVTRIKHTEASTLCIAKKETLRLIMR